MWRGRETKVARSPRVEREREVLLARFPLPSPCRGILNQRKQFPLHLTSRPVATPGFFPDLGCRRGVRYQEGRGRWTGGARGRRFLEVVEEKGSRRLRSDCLCSLGGILAIVDYVSERARDLAGSRAEARTLHGRKDRGKTGGRYFVALIERSMFGMCWRFVLLGVMTAVLTRNGAEICGVENALYLRSSW